MAKLGDRVLLVRYLEQLVAATSMSSCESPKDFILRIAETNNLQLAGIERMHLIAKQDHKNAWKNASAGEIQHDRQAHWEESAEAFEDQRLLEDFGRALDADATSLGEHSYKARRTTDDE